MNSKELATRTHYKSVYAHDGNYYLLGAGRRGEKPDTRQIVLKVPSAIGRGWTTNNIGQLLESQEL